MLLIAFLGNNIATLTFIQYDHDQQNGELLSHSSSTDNAIAFLKNKTMFPRAEEDVAVSHLSFDDCSMCFLFLTFNLFSTCSDATSQSVMSINLNLFHCNHGKKA